MYHSNWHTSNGDRDTINNNTGTVVATKMAQGKS
jgi:hypothetical protein